jgi:hypothetical protein
MAEPRNKVQQPFHSCPGRMLVGSLECRCVNEFNPKVPAETFLR